MQASVKTKEAAVLRCAAFLKKLQVSSIFFKKRLRHRYYPIFRKIFKNAVLIEHVLDHKY